MHTARYLAQISPKTAPEDQKNLAGNLYRMPNEVIANITKYKVAQPDPHNLTTDQQSELTLIAVKDGRKKLDIEAKTEAKPQETGTTPPNTHDPVFHSASSWPLLRLHWRI